MQLVQLPSRLNPLLTVSKAHEHVWVIELHNGEDNRLTEEMCVSALGPALVMVEAQWRDSWRIPFNDKNDKEKTGGHGALIIVSNRQQNKFFSNGFDIATLMTKPQFIHSELIECFIYMRIHRLITCVLSQTRLTQLPLTS
ncbi:hypothetical protein FS842_011349 [Serendipita sp. 407]|nr:hypothetical protein FS842_011349 [Serendipita sp. 407]